jgi:hypothetical protein
LLMTTVFIYLPAAASAALRNRGRKRMFRIALVAAVLSSTAVAVPAVASPACDKPGAAQLHAVHEQAEAVPVVGGTASAAAHQAESAYCGLPGR